MKAGLQDTESDNVFPVDAGGFVITRMDRNNQGWYKYEDNKEFSGK